MSLKVRIPARLKALFSGVALSKKSIEAITEKLSVGLTDESTDEDIDAKLNARNEIYSFDDQRKFDDYQAGKAAKEAADKEAARLKAIEEGKPAPVEVDPDETATDKALRLIMEKLEKQDQAIAAIGHKEVATTRREQYAKTLDGTSDAFKAKALKDFDRMSASFKDDDDFNTFLAEATEDAKGFIQDEANTSLGNDRPAGGYGKPATGEKEVSPAMKELIAEREAKAKTTAQTV